MRCKPRAMTRSPVLLTGATGFVGMAVLARLLERTDRDVQTLVRAESQADADARMRGVLDRLFDDPHLYADRVHAIPGDLVQPDLGLSIRTRERIASEVDEIIHCGASVAFDLSLRESRAINVAGTSRVLGLAELCAARGGLRRMIYGPLRAFAAGTYPVLPGRRGALVDVVTVDYVADALLALSEMPEAVGGC